MLFGTLNDGAVDLPCTAASTSNPNRKESSPKGSGSIGFVAVAEARAKTTVLGGETKAVAGPARAEPTKTALLHSGRNWLYLVDTILSDAVDGNNLIHHGITTTTTSKRDKSASLNRAAAIPPQLQRRTAVARRTMRCCEFCVCLDAPRRLCWIRIVFGVAAPAACFHRALWSVAENGADCCDQFWCSSEDMRTDQQLPVKMTSSRFSLDTRQSDGREL